MELRKLSGRIQMYYISRYIAMIMALSIQADRLEVPIWSVEKVRRDGGCSHYWDGTLVKRLTGGDLV
jgi:hypothetical protein